MRKITYDLSVKVDVEMPDDFDPKDVFIDLNYEFYAPDEVEILGTDIYDMEMKEVK